MKRYPILATLAGLVLATASLVRADEPAATQPAQEPKVGVINLDYTETEAPVVLDKLARQGGVEIIVNNEQIWEQAGPVTVHVKDGKFWPTLIDVCKQAQINFDVQNYGDGRNPIRIDAAGNNQSRFSKYPQAQVEGFIIAATNASRNYYVSYDNPAQINSNVNLQMQILCDPAANVLQVFTPTLTEAVDENGLSLITPGNRNREYYGGERSGLMSSTSVALTYPDKAGRTLAKLKGELTYMKMKTFKTITIDKLDEMKEPVTNTVGDAEVVINPLTKNGERNYMFKVEFHYSEPVRRSGLTRENRNPYSLMQSIILTDANGRRYTTGGGGGGGGPTSYSYDVQFYNSNNDRKLGPPAKLVWRLPSETAREKIAFELSNLPLP